MKLSHYLLQCESSGCGYLIPDELEYFNTHFIGIPMSRAWVSPKVSPAGNQRKWKDFISWMRSAPVVSDKCKKLLEPFIGPYVEFLPLVSVHGQQLFAMNVTCVHDCLDINNSDVRFDSETKQIVDISRYVLDVAKLPGEPVFKVTPISGVIVSHIFREFVENHSLTGCVLVNPSANPFSTLLRESPYVVRL